MWTGVDEVLCLRAKELIAERMFVHSQLRLKFCVKLEGMYMYLSVCMVWWMCGDHNKNIKWGPQNSCIPRERRPHIVTDTDVVICFSFFLLLHYETVAEQNLEVSGISFLLSNLIHHYSLLSLSWDCFIYNHHFIFHFYCYLTSLCIITSLLSSLSFPHSYLSIYLSTHKNIYHFFFSSFKLISLQCC